MGIADRDFADLLLTSAQAARFSEVGTIDDMLSYVTDFVVPRLDAALRSLVDEIDQQHLLAGATSNLMVHYTSVTTIESILQAIPEGANASLRLYDSANFNDPEEGTYFDRMLELPPRHDWFMDEEAHSSHAYIVSFIRPPSDGDADATDDLVFWRTYGERGEGCSLKVAVPTSRIREVHYGPTHRDRIREPLLLILDAVEPLAKIGPPLRRLLASTVWDSLETIRYLYKSDAHDYEHECRLVIPSTAVEQSRIVFECVREEDSLVRVRHYVVDNDLDAKDILASNSRITLGPCVNNPGNVRFYLDALKRRAGLPDSHPEITVSRIPYRTS